MHFLLVKDPLNSCVAPLMRRAVVDLSRKHPTYLAVLRSTSRNWKQCHECIRLWPFLSRFINWKWSYCITSIFIFLKSAFKKRLGAKKHSFYTIILSGILAGFLGVWIICKESNCPLLTSRNGRLCDWNTIIDPVALGYLSKLPSKKIARMPYYCR